MDESIEVCLRYLRRFRDPPSKDETPMSLVEYFKGFGTLNVLDFFLFLFLVIFIVGIAFSFTENKDKTAILLSISFMGVIAFMTLKMTNERLASDICLTCIGQNKMSYNSRLDVVLSFLWAIIQTFIGLVINAVYYFVILYALYIVLRSHLMYGFADEANKETDKRLMSQLHMFWKFDIEKRFSEPSIIPLPIQFIGLAIYWSLMIAIMVAVVLIVFVSFIKPKLISKLIDTAFSKTQGQIMRIFIIFLPLLLTGITILMNKLSTVYMFDRIDKIIAHNVVPLLHHTTLMKGFDFFDSRIFMAHIVAFINAVVNAVLYAFVFLDPIPKSEMCTQNKEPFNANPKFEIFKNRFLIGHYIIGSLMILTYTAVIGEDIGIGTAIVKYGLLFMIIMYACSYLLMFQYDSTEDADTYES